MRLRESLRGMKIALVEDDPWIRNGLQLFFLYHGCRLEGYENAALAIDALTREKCDIIISDYWLPDLDGLALVARLKEHQPEAFFLLITSYPTTGLREEAARTGIHELLTKPLTIPKLEESLEGLIARSSSAVGGGP